MNTRYYMVIIMIIVSRLFRLKLKKFCVLMIKAEKIILL